MAVVFEATGGYALGFVFMAIVAAVCLYVLSAVHRVPASAPDREALPA